MTPSRFPTRWTRPYKAPYTMQLGAGARRHHGSGAHDVPAQPDQPRAVFRRHGRARRTHFYERHENHFLGSSTRRVDDNVWVRVNELILPNFTQAGAAFAADGTASRYFGRSAFTRWVVPVDDENSIAFGWGNFGERGDPARVQHQGRLRADRAGRDPRPLARRTPAQSGRFRGSGRHGHDLDPYG